MPISFVGKMREFKDEQILGGTFTITGKGTEEL